MKKTLLTILFGTLLSASAMAVEIGNVRVTTRQVDGPMKAPAKVPFSSTKADVLVNENFESWTEGTNLEPYFDMEINSMGNAPGIDQALTHGEQWYGYKVYMAGGAAAMQTFSMDQSILNTPRMDYSGSVKLTFLTRALVSQWEDEEGKLMEDHSAHLLVGLSEEQGRPFETNAKGLLVDLQMYEDMGWMEVTVEFDNYSAYNQASFVFAGSMTLLVDDIRITTSSDEFIAVPVLTGVSNVTEDSFTIGWEKVRKSYNYYIWLYTYEGVDPETGEDIYEIVFPAELLSNISASGMTVDEYIEAMGGPDSPYLKYDMVSRHDNLTYTFKDLDPSKEYAYAVMSHNVYQFSEKRLQRMTLVPAPALLDATEITDTSFKANWSKLTKAASYDVNLYGVTVVEEDSDDYPIFFEDFEKTSQYSHALDINAATPCTASMTLDDIATNPGWTLNGPLAMEVPGAGEMPLAYMLDGWFGAGMNMTLSSPSVYVANGDFVDIEMYLQCVNPDANIVLQFAGAMYMANMGGNTSVSAQLTLPTNDLDETKLELACMDNEGSPLFIDYISMTQPLKMYDKLYTLLSTTSLPAEETSHVFDGLDQLPYYVYAYSVAGVTEDGRRSETSQRKNVLFKPISSVDELEGAASDAVEVARYSIDGRKLQAPAQGINIILYSDGTTKKELVK